MGTRMIAEHEAGALAGVYREIREQLGCGLVPNVFKAMAAVGTDVLRQNWTAFRRTLLEGRIPRSVKEMIGLVVARECGSTYSVQLHSKLLRSQGVSSDLIAELAADGDAASLPPPTRKLLQFARAYVDDPDGMGTEVLEAQGMSEDEALEVLDTILITMGINQFAAESDVPLDPF